jgi:transcriptional regulator with XRE-family HTH domain
MDRKRLLLALGSVIRKRRTTLEISQEVLAQLSDLDRSYMGGVERGERNVSWLNLVKISKAMGLSVSRLVEGAKQ